MDSLGLIFRHRGLSVSVLSILLAMLLSFLAFGLWAPYWNKGTANLISVYEALLYNDNIKQEFVWYPNYLSPQLLGMWYQLVHFVGLLPQYQLSGLPSSPSPSQFDATWQKLVIWGRVLSFALGGLYVFLTMVLIRRLTGLLQIAVLAGIALAFSDSIALAYRIMRSELLSSALVFLSLLLTLVACREGPSSRRLVYLFLAGLLVALALTEKVQALLPALTIPPIALLFGENDGDAADVSQLAWYRAIVLCLLGLVLIAPTIVLIERGIAGMSESHQFSYRPLAYLAGIYQWFLVSYVIISMLIYAWLYRVRAVETVSCILAVLVGLALGFLALYARYNLDVIIAVANPIEHLHAVSATPESQRATTSAVTLGSKFLMGIGKAFAVHTFFLSPSHRPTLVIEWLALLAALIVWRRGDKKAALQIGVLLLAAFAVDASFTLRGGSGGGLKIYYAPYTDPFIILAGAIALTHFRETLLSSRGKKAVLAFMLAYVILGNFESARATYGGHRKTKVCTVAAQFLRRVEIPYCQASP
jgi:hypothetical protein